MQAHEFLISVLNFVPVDDYFIIQLHSSALGLVVVEIVVYQQTHIKTLQKNKRAVCILFLCAVLSQNNFFCNISRRLVNENIIIIMLVCVQRARPRFFSQCFGNCEGNFKTRCKGIITQKKNLVIIENKERTLN
jgi:hypothetical protein